MFQSAVEVVEKKFGNLPAVNDTDIQIKYFVF